MAKRYRWIILAVFVGFGLGFLTHALIGQPGAHHATTKQLNSGRLPSGRVGQEGEGVLRSSRTVADGKASILARRYERALSVLSEEGNFVPALSFRDNLDPTDKMAEFFDLTPEDFAQLKDVAARARQEIQEWEIANAKSIESEEYEFGFEVSVDRDFAEQVRERFEEGLQGVVGQDGAKILAASANQFFNESTARRQVTMDVLDGDDGMREVRFRSQTLNGHGEVIGTNGSNYFEFPEGSGKKDFGSFRYQHLLRGR
jgi:hypothetical protein